MQHAPYRKLSGFMAYRSVQSLQTAGKWHIVIMSLHQVLHMHLASDKQATAFIFVPSLLSEHTS